MGKIFISFTGLLFRPSIWYHSSCSAPPLSSAPCTGCHLLPPMLHGTACRTQALKMPNNMRESAKLNLAAATRNQPYSQRVPRKIKPKNICLKDVLTPKLCYETGTLLKMLNVLQWKAVIQVSFILCFNLREKEKNTTLLNFKTE